MAIFQDAGATEPSEFVGDFEDRLPLLIAIPIIAGLSALSWGVLIGMVLVLQALF